MTSFAVQMLCDLWDLAQDGCDQVLDRLRGEIGVTGISVPVVCPPVWRLRTNAGGKLQMFHTGGGALFRPQLDRYTATRCKPVVAEWAKSRDTLRRVIDACRKRDLKFRAVIHATTAGQFAARNPDAAAKTAFGQAWPDRICAVNPDVQALLAALCADVADNYEPDGIELAELHIGRRCDIPAALKPACDLGSGGGALLGMCFCESCLQLGASSGDVDDFDASAAARSAEVRLQRILETGQPLDASTTGFLADDPPLRAHVTAQWGAVKQALRTIRKRYAGDLAVRVYDDAVGAAECTLDALTDAGADALVAEHTSGSSPQLTVDNARMIGARPELQMRAYLNDEADGSDADGPGLVRRLSRVAEMGVAAVSLDGYGSIPHIAWAAVKQAVRFARRKPGS